MSMNFGSLTMSRAADGFSEAEGYSVRCLEEPDKVYRWSEGELHHYPSGVIASSWDEDWREALVEMDCANIPKGVPMSSRNGDTDLLRSSTKKEPIVTTTTAPKISPVDEVIDIVGEESCELQKVEAGRILTWSEARDYDIERYHLPTQEDIKLSNVRPDRGIWVDEWQPVRRLDGVEGDYVQIGTWQGDNAYMSHYSSDRIGYIPGWGYNNQAHSWRAGYFYACLL
jgi:hypothetical protein